MDNSVTHRKRSISDPLPRALFYRGLSARVAAQLGVSRVSVCRVVKGELTSARITKAILQEIRRVERMIDSRRAA